MMLVKMNEKQPVKIVSARCPEDLWQQAREKAIKKRTSLQAVVTGLLRAWVAGEIEPPP